MLFVNMSEKGHYEAGAKRVNTPIYPIIPSPSGRKYTLPNGCYNVDLNIKQTEDETTVTLAKGTDTVWILGQEDKISWHSKYDKSNCGCGKNVSLFRNMGSDIIAYEMPVDSWLLTGDIVYHNNGGILVKYSAENIIGFETWNSLMHCFILPNAISYIAQENASTNDPYFASKPFIHF